MKMKMKIKSEKQGVGSFTLIELMAVRLRAVLGDRR